MNDTSPGLVWGIKRSFLQYIARMPDGRCSATDGANLLDKSFHFSLDVDSGQAVGIVKFRGDVRFSGHNRMLFLRIAHPWLHTDTDGSAATLTIDGAPKRVILATLDLLTENDGHRGVNVRLSEHGSELFNLAYPAGEVLDDLKTLRIQPTQKVTT